MQWVMEVAGQYLLPLALWLVMYSMGLGLAASDFRRIVVNKRAFVVGAGSMILLVPIIGTALAFSFAPTPALTMGFILLATCPGGILSNLLSDLAGGDVALSVSMSLFVSVIYIGTLPIITYLALGAVFGEAQALAVPVGDSFAKIMMVTVIPVSAGMLSRKLLPTLAGRLLQPVKTISTSVLTVVFAMIVVQQWDALRRSAGIVLAIVIAMNVLNLTLAYMISRVAGLARAERISVAMEHIVRQEATAIFVAVTLLHRDDMSLPMIVNTFIGMAVGIPFVAWLRSRSGRQLPAESEVAAL